MGKVAPKVDEAIETLNMRDSPTRRRLIAGAGLVSATAAASALLTACSSSSSTAAAAASGGSGAFPSVPSWQFWFVNHVTTNPFFVPTQYGLQDAAVLLDELQAVSSADAAAVALTSPAPAISRRRVGLSLMLRVSIASSTFGATLPMRTSSYPSIFIHVNVHI